MTNPQHVCIVEALQACERASKEHEQSRTTLDLLEEKLDQVVLAALQAEFPNMRLTSLDWQEGPFLLEFWYDMTDHCYCVQVPGDMSCAGWASSPNSWADALASRPEVAAHQTFLRLARVPPWQCLCVTEAGDLVWLQQEPVTSLLPIAQEALTAAYAWDTQVPGWWVITLVLPPGCKRWMVADELNQMSDLSIFVTERWEWNVPSGLTGIATT